MSLVNEFQQWMRRLARGESLSLSFFFWYCVCPMSVWIWGISTDQTVFPCADRQPLLPSLNWLICPTQILENSTGCQKSARLAFVLGHRMHHRLFQLSIISAPKTREHKLSEYLKGVSSCIEHDIIRRHTRTHAISAASITLGLTLTQNTYSSQSSMRCGWLPLPPLPLPWLTAKRFMHFKFVSLESSSK